MCVCVPMKNVDCNFSIDTYDVYALCSTWVFINVSLTILLFFFSSLLFFCSSVCLSRKRYIITISFYTCGCCCLAVNVDMIIIMKVYARGTTTTTASMAVAVIVTDWPTNNNNSNEHFLCPVQKTQSVVNYYCDRVMWINNNKWIDWLTDGDYVYVTHATIMSIFCDCERIAYFHWP